MIDNMPYGSLVGKRLRVKPWEFFSSPDNNGDHRAGQILANRLCVVIRDEKYDLRVRFLDDNSEQSFTYRPNEQHSWFLIDSITCEDDE